MKQSNSSLKFKNSQFKFIFASVILLVLLATTISVQAESVKPRTKKIQFVAPPPPIRWMPSGRQQGGASRGGCPAVSLPLTAIVPARAKVASRTAEGIATLTEKNPLAARYSVGGLTTSKHPSFWFYVPYISPKLPMEFVLQDELNRDVYKSSLNIVHEQAGFVRISIPQTVASLQVGKIYQWFFLVNCDTEAPPFVKGWLKRVATNFSLPKTLDGRVAVYAANGIWYDALDTLAQLRLTNPNDPNLMSNWDILLEAAGIDKIASEPITRCCTLDRASNKALSPVADHNVTRPKNR